VDDPAAFPDSCYHDAVCSLVNGDEQRARRAIEEGLAHASAARHEVARACLGDLAAQLDGEAALARLARRTPGPVGWLANPDALARSVVALGRAHLVEAVIEEIAHLMPEDQLMALVVAAYEARTPACHDLLVAVGSVVEGAPGRLAAQFTERVPASDPCIDALRVQVPVAAWTSEPVDAPGQQQVIIAVGRDAGRVAPVVAIIRHEGVGAVLDDAFALPDMIPARLEREVLEPMANAGLTPDPLSVRDAAEAVYHALLAALDAGLDIPSAAYQPVAARLRRALVDDSPSASHGSGEMPCMG
jgi:hypothetical protein